MNMSRTRLAAAGTTLLALLLAAGCGTDPAAEEPEATSPPPPVAVVVERVSYEERPANGYEATLGGVGYMRVCLVDSVGEPTEDCTNVGVMDALEWDAYRVGDDYPVAGTSLERTDG